jgi:hypothetical protein
MTMLAPARRNHIGRPFPTTRVKNRQRIGRGVVAPNDAHNLVSPSLQLLGRQRHDAQDPQWFQLFGLS